MVGSESEEVVGPIRKGFTPKKTLKLGLEG